MGDFLKKILNCIPEFPGISWFRKQDDFVDLKNSNTAGRKKKLLGRLLLLVCLLVVVFLFQINLYISNSKFEIKQVKGVEPYSTQEYSTDKLKKRYTILVLGKENKNRADTIILCHIFLDTGKVHLMSLPRDTRVPIFRNNEIVLDKLNHTFRWGGLAMLKDSLTRFLHINIDHSIVVDLKLFRKIIDTLGGVEVDVLKDMYYEDKADSLTIDIKKGKQYLSGKNAEGYVRFRADGMGDLGRIKRQKKFILSFEQRLRDLFSFRWKNIAFIGRLPKFFVSLLKDVETDLTSDLVFKLLLRFRDMKTGALKHGTLKGEGLYLHVKNYKKKISFFVSSRKDKIASYSWLFQTNNIPKEILDPLNDPSYMAQSSVTSSLKTSQTTTVSIVNSVSSTSSAVESASVALQKSTTDSLEESKQTSLSAKVITPSIENTMVTSFESTADQVVVSHVSKMEVTTSSKVSIEATQATSISTRAPFVDSVFNVED